MDEIIWARILSLVFGSTIDANTVIISAFMLGLGLGGIYLGKRADSVKDPVGLLTLIQFGTGLGSLIILLIFPLLPRIYSFIVKILGGGSSILIFILSFVLMLIPTFLMGGTLPLISKIYIKERQKIAIGFSQLYALNTLGGVIGAGIVGYFLIRAIGIRSSQLLAILINLGCGFFLLGRRIPLRLKTNLVKDSINSGDFRNNPDSNYFLSYNRFYPLIAGLIGFVSLGYEIFWIRTLSIFLANASYTFTTILIIYLLGIVSGSFFFYKRLSKLNQIKLLFVAQIATGCYVLITAFFLNNLPGLLFPIRSILEKPFYRIFLTPGLLSFLIVFIPTFLMGITFPLLCTIWTKNLDILGNGIGRIYFANTVGSVTGSLGVGFLLLPLFGVVRGIILFALLNLIIGVLIVKVEKQKKNLKFGYLLSGIMVILSIFGMKNNLILPPSIYRSPERADRVLYYKETKDGTVIVNEDRNTGVKTCYVNNSAVIGSTYDAIKVVKMMGHLPFLFNPKAKDVLVIGFGVGVTTSAIARHNVREIDCVEICPGVREASKYFSNINDFIFNNPKVKFIPGDGRNFLQLTDKKYDIISCDPTHPSLGSGNLYTKEYFLLCKGHLKENGVVCQYLPLHRLSIIEFKSLVKTFASVFSYTTIWLGYSHGILIGTENFKKIDFPSLKVLPDDLLKDPYWLAVSLILDREKSIQFSQEAEINTDDRPLVEFFTPVSLRRENWELIIRSLLALRIEPEKAIENIENLEKLKRYVAGQEFFISGLIYQNRSQKEKMIEEFEKALKVNPENLEIKLILENELR